MAIVLLFTGCAKDNYEPPRAVLTGRVVYQGQPLPAALYGGEYVYAMLGVKHRASAK
jgi:hypothetical protein